MHFLKSPRCTKHTPLNNKVDLSLNFTQVLTVNLTFLLYFTTDISKLEMKSVVPKH